MYKACIYINLSNKLDMNDQRVKGNSYKIDNYQLNPGNFVSKMLSQLEQEIKESEKCHLAYSWLVQVWWPRTC